MTLHNPIKSTIRAGSLSLGLVLALAGCSGDDGESGASDGATATVGNGLSTTAGSAGGGETESEGSASESASSGGESESAGTTTTGDDSAGTTDTPSTTTTGDDPTTTTGEDTDDTDSTTGEPINDCSKELEELGERPPYIWISNTTGGTVTKINTETAVIEGRYITNAAQAFQPSRTTVNDLGDMMVAHRESPGGLTKIAGHPKNCLDLNGNGTIDTSTGFDDVRAWGSDECVLWHTETPGGTGARGVAWEPSPFNKDTCTHDNPNPRVWAVYRPAGGVGRVLRLDGATGTVLDTIDADIGGSGLPYGGAVDADGNFWWTSRSGPFLFRIDSETLEVSRYTTPNNPYGVAIDAFGNPFLADYHGGAGVDTITRFNVMTETFEQIPGGTGRFRGIQIDTDGIGWVAGNQPCRLVKVDTKTDTLLEDSIPLPGCSDPVGVSIDEEGDVWVVDRGSAIAYEIDPETHAIKNTITNLIGPYTYSDMTGGSLRLVQGPKPG